MINTPEEVAAELIADNFPIRKYEELQEVRKERVIFFQQKTGVQYLVDQAQELVDFGEKVLKLMREAEEETKQL